MDGRIKRVDIAKGIGIMLVVLGHNWIVLQSRGKLFNIIFSFHVPLFFFLSGLFFKPEEGLKALARRRTDSLLKPYFVVLTLLAIPAIYKGISPAKYLLGVFFGTGSSLEDVGMGAWGPLWFLTSLWIVNIFSYLFLKVTKYEDRPPLIKMFLLAALLLSGFFIIKLSYHVPDIDLQGHAHYPWGLPFCADLVCMNSFYFMCGFTLRTHILKMDNYKINRYFFLGAIATFASLHYFFNYTINLNWRVYDNLLVSTAEAACGIYIVFMVSCMIPKITARLGNSFAYVGSGSLFILIFHGVYQNTFYPLSALINNAFICALISFFAGVGLPLLLWKYIMKTRYLSLLCLPVKFSKVDRFPKTPANKREQLQSSIEG